MWIRYFLVPLLIVLFADTTPAGIFKKTGQKPDPSTHVPELISILKGDKDENRRLEAAAELREYDPKTFPELMPALIDSLQNDPSSSVRTEAVNSLSKIRPITQQAGYALEQALANDSSVRVRVAARTTLWQFHLLGYRSGKPNDGGDNQSKEPPLAAPKNKTPNPANPKAESTPSPSLHPLVQQSRQAQSQPVKPTPMVQKVQPPLLAAPPLLPSTKTNPVISPKVGNQSAEPPLAEPVRSPKVPETRKPEPKVSLPTPPAVSRSSSPPVESRKPEPKLSLPSTPPSIVEVPVTKPVTPTVQPKLQSEVKPPEVEGPILSPPKD